MESNEYDLVAIGSGLAGQKGAICAAKMRKKVATSLNGTTRPISEQNVEKTAKI